MRRRVVAASAALIALLLTGCASIPTSGGVQRGEPVAADPVDLDILALGPAPGATPQQIVDGFISAAQSPRDNYLVARKFLTPDFADEWQADAGGATIDVLADRDAELVDPSTIRVLATPAASLRDDGQYEEPDSASPVPLDYRLTQVGGEWRIASAPKGILIDEVSFAQVFRPYTLSFFDPTFRFLVPDVRWYAGRDSAQTSIVRSLLRGAAAWLAPGVVSAFPEGTELEPASVPVVDGVATVSLAGPPVGDLATVQQMQVQLEANLIGVRDIESVVLRLNGVAPEVPAPSERPVGNVPLDPRSVVFDGETFGYLATSGESIAPLPDLSERVTAAAPTAAALGPGAKSAAVLNAEGVSLLRTDADPVLLDRRPGLIAPAVDGEGIVWSVPAGAPDQLVWFAADGTSKQVAVPWSGSAIAAIEVSHDSTRILALLVDGGRTHFVAASIERGPDGRPVQLGNVPLRLSGVSGVPLDVAWLDARTVASLTALPDGTTRIITQELGGFASERDGPPGGVALDGGNNDLRVLTAAGDLDVRAGVGWQVRASGIRFVASQQAG